MPSLTDGAAITVYVICTFLFVAAPFGRFLSGCGVGGVKRRDVLKNKKETKEKGESDG